MKTSPLLDRLHFNLSDGTALKLYSAPTKKQCRGYILFAHGMLEYGGRYLDWGQKIAEEGYSFLAVDHRGHGASDGLRVWMNSVDDYVDDFQLLAEALIDSAGDLPVFIVGMSMGGGIALRTAVRLQNRAKTIAGVILAAPALRPHRKVVPKFLTFFAPLLDRLFPKWRILHGTTVGLCHDKEVLQRFQNDPLIHSGPFSIHYGYANFTAAAQNLDLCEKLTLPILIVQGTGDTITSPSGPKEFIERGISTDKTLKLYPDLYHDILHEPNSDQVTGDILDWLNQRAAL